MNKILSEVIVDILTYNGAIIEKKGDDCLDIIAPQEVSSVLGIPEYARLSFSYDETSEETIYASYGSEFFNSIKNLFNTKGRFTNAYLEANLPNIEKISKVIPEKIVFKNATFRLDRIETKEIFYLLIYFKHIALSDERQEGILPLLINEMNLSTMPFEDSVDDLLERLKESESVYPLSNEDGNKIFQSVYSAATMVVQERLRDFIKSLERRINRDIKRVYEYYETLKNEIKTAMGRKGTIAEGSAEEIHKLTDKFYAIESEQKWKIKDLIAKYALSIQIEPVAGFRIKTNTHVFWINIKRRLASRTFPFTYNPILRQLDISPCESCFNPQEGYYICDERLHIICGNCFKACPHCEKQYCKACYITCPKCRKKEER